MQTNPVHALIGLLRNEAQRGILGREQKLQLNALADILLESKDAKERLIALEQAIARGEIKQASAAAKPRVANPGWPDFEHEAPTVNPREFSVRVGNKTSDAINRAMTEQHGRSWNNYPSNDNSGTGGVSPGAAESYSASNQRAHRDPHSDMPPGFAFPFQPTADDVQHALRTGKGWPPELGEEVRLRILRETMRQEREEVAVAPFWPFVIVIMVAAAVVLWLISKF